MKTKKLISIEVILDAEPPYSPGDMDYSAPYPEMHNWVNASTANRDKLADWLEELAIRCRAGREPFRREEESK